MDHKTPITRRTALALTALATLVGSKAAAAPEASAIVRLSERLARDMGNGMTGFHFTPGPKFADLSQEQRAQAMLDMLEAGDRARRLTPTEIADL